jgi:hypothetical protein
MGASSLLCVVIVAQFSGIKPSNTGLSRFRQVGERYAVMQVKSESTLVNQGSKQIDANNIVPFARKAAPVAA